LPEAQVLPQLLLPLKLLPHLLHPMLALLLLVIIILATTPVLFAPFLGESGMEAMEGMAVIREMLEKKDLRSISKRSR